MKNQTKQDSPNAGINPALVGASITDPDEIERVVTERLTEPLSPVVIDQPAKQNVTTSPGEEDSPPDA